MAARKKGAKGGAPAGAKASKGAALKASRPKSRAVRAKLLSGENPQIPKGEGDAPVQAYIKAMPGWKEDVARRMDTLVVETVPGVQKAVKWNSAFYGIEREGWFLAFHAFTNYLKVTFFRGASLRPMPPEASSQSEVRYVHLRESEFDEQQLSAWVRQAAALPGWSP